jgi:ferredoxin--NADP+ reductase
MDQEKGILSVIYQVIGASTEELSTLTDEIFAVVGPLGNANEICAHPEAFKDKRIVYVAGGVGIAPVYPQVKYLKEKGFDVDIIYGSREKDLLLIRDKAEAVARQVYYATDD